MDDNEKELSIEEKLYITIEYMYENGLFDIDRPIRFTFLIENFTKKE